MSSAKTIAKNAGFLFSTEVLDKIISFVLIVVITRYLGDAGFGKYSFAFAFISLFTIISNLGLPTYIFREISKDRSKAKELLNNAMAIMLFIMLLIFSFAIIITKFWPKAWEIVTAIILVQIYTLFDVFNQNLRMVFNAYEKNQYKLYTLTAERVLSLLFGIIILSLGYGLNGLLIALIAAKIVSSFIHYMVMYKKFFVVSLSIDKEIWSSLIKNSIPFWLTWVFQRIYQKIDTIMLTAIKNYQVTGWYNAAATLTSALTFIPAIIINATFPAMSKFHQTNQDSLKMLYKKSFYYALAIGAPISIGIMMLSQRIILFIYKSAFIESGIVLQILSWSLFFVFLSQVIGFFLNSINKQHLFSISTGICALANVVVNFILIPRFSYIGASIATVITQFINFCVLYYFTFKNGYPLNLIKMSYKPVIAGVAMAIVISVLRSLPIIMIIPISAASYLLILFLIKGIGKDEINLIKSFRN